MFLTLAAREPLEFIVPLVSATSASLCQWDTFIMRLGGNTENDFFERARRRRALTQQSASSEPIKWDDEMIRSLERASN